MQTETYDLFKSAISDIANGPRLNSFQDLTEGLLRRLSENGLTLKQCADRRILNRSIRTLETHCRVFGIRFPDYVPSNMCTQIQFIPTGDYLELKGSEAEAVAAVLDIAVTERDGITSCAVPARSWDECKINLREAGFVARKGKASKARKVKANG